MIWCKTAAIQLYFKLFKLIVFFSSLRCQLELPTFFTSNFVQFYIFWPHIHVTVQHSITIANRLPYRGSVESSHEKMPLMQLIISLNCVFFRNLAQAEEFLLCGLVECAFSKELAFFEGVKMRQKSWTRVIYQEIDMICAVNFSCSTSFQRCVLFVVLLHCKMLRIWAMSSFVFSVLCIFAFHLSRFHPIVDLVSLWQAVELRKNNQRLFYVWRSWSSSIVSMLANNKQTIILWKLLWFLAAVSAQLSSCDNFAGLLARCRSRTVAAVVEDPFISRLNRFQVLFCEKKNQNIARRSEEKW